jgi:hypothetical protein
MQSFKALKKKYLITVEHKQIYENEINALTIREARKIALDDFQLNNLKNWKLHTNVNDSKILLVEDLGETK